MFSEMKRYMTYRVRYLFNSICDVIYSFIFITGIIVIVDSKAPINILYFFTYYLITNVILLANEELEYEIRTNQYMNIKTTKQTPLMIYIYRSGTYFIWSALIFLMSISLAQIFFKGKWLFPTLTVLEVILMLMVNGVVALVLYILAIKLTERFKRVSVFLHLMNSLMLFYSGLVFPVPFFTYANVLDFIVGI